MRIFGKDTEIYEKGLYITQKSQNLEKPIGRKPCVTSRFP